MAENAEKKLLVKEAHSIIKGLSQSDRRLLRAYFSYSKVKQLPDSPLKKPSQACAFVRSLLWPKNKKNKKRNKEQSTTEHLHDDDKIINERPLLTEGGARSLLTTRGGGVVKNKREEEEEEEEQEEEEESHRKQWQLSSAFAPQRRPKFSLRGRRSCQ